MPESYRQQHGDSDAREHAQIAWRRGDAVAHGELWQKRRGAAIVCIVADERGGLRSLVRATIAAHGLDVLAEQDYSRRNERGHDEAVNFYWLGPARDGQSTEISHDDVSRIADALSALLRGDVDLGAVIERISTVPPSSQATPPPPPEGVNVAIGERNDPDGSVLLTIEAADRPGVLMAITSALFAKRISVVRSEVTTSGGRARGRFQMIEADGSALAQQRAAEVAKAVTAALLASND